MKHILVFICGLGMALCSFTVFAEDERNNEPDRLFDEYGNISWREEQARLDNFAIALQQDTNLIGYITVYAGRRSCEGAAQARAIRAKKYLIERRGVERSRVLWIDAGYLEESHVVLQPAERGANIIFPMYNSLSSKEVQILHCKAKTTKRKKSWQSVNRA